MGEAGLRLRAWGLGFIGFGGLACTTTATTTTTTTTATGRLVVLVVVRKLTV